MNLSKCTICNSKKSRFIKEQEAGRFLSNFGLKTTLSKIPLLGYIIFFYVILLFERQKSARSKNPRVVKTKNKRAMLSSNCVFCGSKGFIFIKEQLAELNFFGLNIFFLIRSILMSSLRINLKR